MSLHGCLLAANSFAVSFQDYYFHVFSVVIVIFWSLFLYFLEVMLLSVETLVGHSFILTNTSNLFAVGITCMRLFRLSPTLDAVLIDVPLDTGRNNNSSILDSSVAVV
jgi:hypothetical protein